VLVLNPAAKAFCFLPILQIVKAQRVAIQVGHARLVVVIDESLGFGLGARQIQLRRIEQRLKLLDGGAVRNANICGHDFFPTVMPSIVVWNLHSRLVVCIRCTQR